MILNQFVSGYLTIASKLKRTSDLEKENLTNMQYLESRIAHYCKILHQNKIKWELHNYHSYYVTNHLDLG